MTISEEQELKELSERLSMLKQVLYELEQSYKNKQALFQEKCGKIGHQFVAEPDDDYHNTRMWYVCKRCDHFTRYRPNQ